MSSFKERILLARIAGAAGDIGATDAVLCRNLQARRLEGNYTEHAIADGMEGASREELFDPHAGASFETDRGFVVGAPGSVPKIGPLLRACGMTETVVALTSVTYAPAGHTDTFEAVEMEYNVGGQRQRLGNARGSLSFTANAGQIPFFAFNFLGAYNPPLAQAPYMPDVTGWFPTPAATTANVGAFTLGGTALCVTQFSFTDGRQPVVNKYMNCPGVDITRRRFTGRMQVKMPDAATKQLIQQCRDGYHFDALVFDLNVASGSLDEAGWQNQRMRITAPKVQLKWAGEVDLDGELGANIDLVFLPDQGDDEIAIISMGQV